MKNISKSTWTPILNTTYTPAQTKGTAKKKQIKNTNQYTLTEIHERKKSRKWKERERDSKTAV